MNKFTTPLLVLVAITAGCVDERVQEEPPPPAVEQVEPSETTPEPEVTVAPTPEPEPTPEPIPEPEVVIDPMEWIQENWRGRLRSVTITKEQSIPVFADGQQVGEAQLPVGRTVPVQKLDGETVTVHFLNTFHPVPAADTDLESRAESALAAAIASSQAEPETSQASGSKGNSAPQAPAETNLRFVNDDPNLQFSENPPMAIRARIPPEPPEPSMQYEVRPGFTVVDSLDDFRKVIKQDGQKIRMKPGVYRAKKSDPPIKYTPLHQNPGEKKVLEQDHIFNVSGSDNHFDLRGAVFETPVSVQSKLKRGGHVADTWHINGANNTFEGGYFRNVVDMPYPDYFVTENEFEICNDGNTFLNCIFVIKGSIPFGYTDFYGKGAGGYGRLNKHSFMSFLHANNTSLIGCQVYQLSFGHALHFHKVDGVLVKDTLISGTLRPTNDIFKETVGRAVDKNFEMVYRSVKPIPRDWTIPLTEDAVRSYNEVKNIVVIDSVVERQRGCFQLLCPGDITLENVAVIESGDFSYDLSSGSQGKTIMKNCYADVAYNPVFNLTRGDTPTDAFYEVTILSPRSDVIPTERTSLGIICGDDSEFILHDGTTTPIPDQYNKLICGGRKGMNGSTITNYTTATLILQGNVRDCRIQSVGPVIDNGSDNRVSKIKAPQKKIWTNPFN
ncbi:MAG: hypothetical protein ACSHYA_03975 [Opitutaceae bacterium]